MAPLIASLGDISGNSYGFTSAISSVVKSGYYMGGNTGSGQTNAITSLAFLTQTATTLAAQLSVNQAFGCGLSNANLGGYSVGGQNPAISTINKISFTVNTTSVLSNALGTAADQTLGMSNSGTAGYIAGGSSNGGGTTFTVIQKLTYSNETNASISATLNPSRGNRGSSGFANNGTAGYVAGGYDGLAYVASIFKLLFSNDSISTISPTLASGQQSGNGAMSNSGTAGYITGGDNTSSAASIQKITYSSDTKSTLSASMANAMNYPIGLQNNGTAGYFAGGYNMNSSVYSSVIARIDFGTDARTNLSATLSTNLNSGQGASNSI